MVVNSIGGGDDAENQLIDKPEPRAECQKKADPAARHFPRMRRHDIQHANSSSKPDESIRDRVRNFFFNPVKKVGTSKEGEEPGLGRISGLDEFHLEFVGPSQ